MAPSPPSPRQKRPRVSFATVSMRTFASGCEDPRKLSSPQERQLSPLLDALSAGKQAAQFRAPDDGMEDVSQELQFPAESCTPDHFKAGDCGSDSGDVTGNIHSLSRLVLEDEQDLRPNRVPLPAQITQETMASQIEGRRTMTLSPNNTETETSPLPEAWDLYKQFQRQQGAFGSTRPDVSEEPITVQPEKAKPVIASAPVRFYGMGQSPPTALHRGRSPDTVDMAPVVKTIEAGPRARWGTDEDQEDSEIPEGRKSFITRLPLYDAGASSNARTTLMNGVPTPLRGQRQGPYEKQDKGPAVKTLGESFKASPKAPEPKLFTTFEKANLQKELEAKSASSKDALPAPATASTKPTIDKGAVPFAGIGALQHRRSQERRSTRTSSVFGELDSLLYSPTGESALPGSSNFIIPQSRSSVHAPSGSPGIQMAWDEFLGHCCITFPPMEPQPSQVALDDDVDMSAPATSSTQGCPRTERAASALRHRRTGCLQKAIEELARHNEATKKQYLNLLQGWNQQTCLPPSASELLKVMDSPHDLEKLRSRIKTWQAHCKDEAWLRWYAAKKEWLRTDLDVAREHTSALKADLQMLREVSRRLQETSKKVRATLRQQHHRSDLQQTARKLRELSEEERRHVEEERQLILRKAHETEGLLELDHRTISDLEARIQEARACSEQSRLELQQAKRSLLQQKARRIELQQQRYARTCLVTKVHHKATATQLELNLRGGARASITRAALGAAGLVRIVFCPPYSYSESQSLSGLAKELFKAAWQDVLKCLPDDQVTEVSSSLMEATLRSGDVPTLIRRLDCATLRTQEQMSALSQLIRKCPEVIDIALNVRDCNDELVIDAALTLVHVTSHSVAGGPGGLTALLHDRLGSVDAFKFVVYFTTGLSCFPDAIDWSHANIRKVFGRETIGIELQHYLRTLACTSLHEVATLLQSFLHRS